MLDMATRVLLVEDDHRIRAALRMALEDEGFTVDEAASGEDGLRTFGRQAPDVALVDLMLPGVDGFEVCRTIRRLSDVPVIIVTARADSHDVVAGLEAGADDYVRKPIVTKELSARIRALLRRARSTGTSTGSGQPTSARLVFDELEILPDEGIVRRDGSEVHLTTTEFKLLCELAASPGRIYSREQLLDKVWATITSATGGSWMCTCGGCGPRSRPTRRRRGTS